MGKGILVPIESNRSAKIGLLDLGQIGVPYVKKALERGDPLSSLVTKLFEGDGTSFAPMEEGATLERAKQFTAGTFMATAAIRKWLADYIESRWGANAQMVFADPWAQPDDAKNQPEPYFIGGKTPYYMPRGTNLYDVLTEGQKEPITRNFPVFIISPSVPPPPTGQYATQAQLEQMAQNTQAVLASAYDHEGYVVWQK